MQKAVYKILLVKVQIMNIKRIMIIKPVNTCTVQIVKANYITQVKKIPVIYIILKIK